MNTKIVCYLTLDLLLFGKYTEYEVFLHTSHLWKHKDNNKYVTKYINYLGYDKFILTSLKKTIKASNPPARPPQGLLPSSVPTSRSQIRFNRDQGRRSSQSILGSSFECCPSLSPPCPATCFGSSYLPKPTSHHSVFKGRLYLNNKVWWLFVFRREEELFTSLSLQAPACPNLSPTVLGWAVFESRL